MNIIRYSSIILITLSLFTSLQASAAVGKFRIDRIGTSSELTAFCVSKGFLLHSRANKINKQFYVICIDQPDEDLTLIEGSIDFLTDTVHEIGATLSLSSESARLCITPKSTPFRSASKLFSTSIQHGRIEKLPLINEYNRDYIHQNKTVNDSFAHLITPLNEALFHSAEAIHSKRSFEESEDESERHNPELIPYIEGLLSSLKNEHKPDLIPESLATFEIELKHAIKTKRVSAAWASSLVSRYLAAESTSDEDALEIFRHAIADPTLYEKLIKKDAWKNAHRFHADINSTIIRGPYPYLILDAEVTRNQMKHLGLLPVPKYALIQNLNFLNPLVLSKAYLDHTFPLVLAKPKSQLRAHGAGGEGKTVSRFAHYFHDLFHAEYFSANATLENAIVEKTLDALKNGAPSAEHYIFTHGPDIQQKYQGILNLFQVIIDTGMADNTLSESPKALPAADKRTQFKAAIAGLFLGIHEYPSLRPAMLNTHSATTVIDLFVARAKANLMAHEVWESPEDPLMTSAKDGTTELTDKEILDIASSQLKDGKLTHYITVEDISLITVSKSKRFIDLTIREKNNRTHKIPFPTLYHKLTNSEDNYKLLQYAGRVNNHLIALHKQAFDKPTDPLVVREYLASLRTGLLDLVDEFGTFAKQIIQRPDEEKHGKTLEETYKNFSSKLSGKIDSAKSKSDSK